ncbi:MAG: type II secretion system GspH family protein [Saccharofermentans sp.]|nr:type II secretion system GspH family protein [Saccharofermentans sp.]
MKKMRKESKKGFTLVELIVVLVILAVLAAMLVPALTGYIKRAREEKEYQTAATVYSAAQAVITDMYGRGKITTSGSLTNTTSQFGSDVFDLAGVNKSAVTAFSFTYGTDYIIKGGTVTINGSTYTLTITNGVPEWKV